MSFRPIWALFFFVGTPSEVHLFDHLLWPIFQTSIHILHYILWVLPNAFLAALLGQILKRYLIFQDLKILKLIFRTNLWILKIQLVFCRSWLPFKSELITLILVGIWTLHLPVPSPYAMNWAILAWIIGSFDLCWCISI